MKHVNSNGMARSTSIVGTDIRMSNLSRLDKRMSTLDKIQNF